MSGGSYDKDSVDAVLSRIETKLDMALLRLDDFEKRIVALERWQWGIFGGSAVISAIVGFLMKLKGN